MILALLAALSCVPHQQYNTSPDQYRQRVLAAAPGAAAAHLAVIEFDDHGVLWDRDQLEATVSLIREANRDARDGTLVLVYMHGWKNNANPADPKGALSKFRETVRANAEKNPEDRPFADGEVVIERVPGAFNDTPFWVIRVSRDIFKEHGDVGNPVYGAMIEQIIKLNEVYRTDVQTWLTAPDRAGD